MEELQSVGGTHDSEGEIYKEFFEGLLEKQRSFAEKPGTRNHLHVATHYARGAILYVGVVVGTRTCSRASATSIAHTCVSRMPASGIVL